MPDDMSASPERRRERRGSFHVRTSVAGKRAPPSPVLVYCISAIALLASIGRTLAPKEELCLGSFWCISLTPVSCKPQGIKYELHTLPVDAKAVTDGDTITVYVNMANHPESGNVPQEVQKAVIERTKAWVAKNCQRANALQKIILDAGYRQVPNMRGEHVLAKKYQIRLRGIDAPESLMPYGKEAKEELVRLVQGKSLKISIYDSDRYGRLVGDVDCNGVSVQEHMLKKGLAWHYTAYDRRMELSKWESQARASRTGLWASPDPEKPWEWRKKKRIGTM
ncbi:probable staphylococcal-like nuclease CAN1 [Panicum virgatum]|uniref:TNase-like domain-containing protein n=1 Tax=Panicum virgatum TaxID=38727 RepID=A0A8T0SB73_PANVG|nr:probable staphylococcal-like nuclease CAN1 [Panicum virgatum]KAG2595477.1 hypothetical protein PVAP13_5KG077000 [Panicum virgatum]